MSETKGNKLFTIIFVIVVGVILSLAYFSLPKSGKDTIKDVKINGIFLSEPKEVSHFLLTDHQGKSFSNDNLQGHWTFLFFGFSHCRSVCPESLSSLNAMYKTLETQLPQSLLPQVVFVTVDPERDTQKRLSQYIQSFNKHFIGARTDASDTLKIEQQFYITAAKVRTDSQDKDHYTIDHTAEIIVINPQGKLQAILYYPHKAEQLAKDYQSLLATTDQSGQLYAKT